MTTSDSLIYPDCAIVVRTVTLGRWQKTDLLAELKRHDVSMNEYGKVLFASSALRISQQPRLLETVELRARNLGFVDGATWPDLFRAAQNYGLGLCPLEAAVYLRLDYLDQPEGDWITVCTPVVTPLPNGFYLRTMDDRLWLRGYTTSTTYKFGADERFIFRRLSV